MDYNAYHNKNYSGVSQPAPSGSGFFQTSAVTPTFLKVPNPSMIKQESSMPGRSLGEPVTPSVNYTHNVHYVNHGDPPDLEKPVFYRKPFDVQFISNSYMQHHPQQFMHNLQPQLHHHDLQHQQPAQQQLQHPPPVPSHSDSQQQLLQHPTHPHHHHQQQYGSSVPDFLDHSNASSVGSFAEPPAFVLHRGPVPVELIKPTPELSVIAGIQASGSSAIMVDSSSATSTPSGRFSCSTCSKKFETKSKLEKHAKTHSGEGDDHVFKCRMCDKIFRTKSTLICHQKVHGENGIDNSFSCVECGRVFATDDKLRVHRRLHTGEMPYQCKVCMKRFNHQSNLIVHVRNHETVKKALKCDRCNKVLDNEERLAIHMRLHTGEKPYKCTYCDKRFNHKSTVSTHEKAAHIAANSFKCGRCHKTFNQKCQLQYHEKLQEEHAIACDLCDKVFCYKASHKEHMFKVHLPRPKKEQKKVPAESGSGTGASSVAASGDESVASNAGGKGRNKFKCTKCDRRFYYKRALELHMGVHDASLDVNILHFSCNYCPETFTEEKLLEQHEDEHVANGTTDFRENMKALEQSDEAAENGQEGGSFRCRLCFKRFEDQQALRDHHRTHLCTQADCSKCERARDPAFDLCANTYDPEEDKRETVCNICHRTLPSFEQFQNHFQYHTTRVPFYCFHCRVEFNDKRELYAHSKTHTPRELESYTCEICAKVFSTKGNFKRHLKSHETVRAFACDRCFKQYDYKSALEAHLKRSHGIEL